MRSFALFEDFKGYTAPSSGLVSPRKNNDLRLTSSAKETDHVKNLGVPHPWVVDAASVAEARHLHRVVA